MPAPAAKNPWELVTYDDVAALASYADGLGIIASAGSSWDYTVGSTNWLTEPDTSPGVLNRIRRDCFTVLQDIDALFGSRGWPETCACSGPWILPPDCYTSPLPGEPDWSGIQTGAAGSHAYLRELVVMANEDMTGVYARGDVNFSGLTAWNGSTYVPDYGWTGTYSGGGWTSLEFQCAFAPDADVIGYQGGADGYAFVTLASSGADVTATANGVSVTVTEVATGGAYKYCADVTGITGATALDVVFSWTSATYGVASLFGCYFSAKHSYAAPSATDEALAEEAFTTGVLDEFRVTAGGGWQIATTYLWPEFDMPRPSPDYLAWCIIGKTLPVKVVKHTDYGTSNRLAPQFQLAESAGASFGNRPEAPSCPMQRTDIATGDNLSDTEYPSLLYSYPHGPIPYIPSQVACWGISGYWVVRTGLAYNHTPLIPTLAEADITRPVAGASVSVEVGMWRGGTLDPGSGLGTEIWSGGTFQSVSSCTLATTTAYHFEPFARLWPVFANKALAWEASPDVVTVTAPMVVRVEIPIGNGDYEGAWDAGAWPGQTNAGFGSAVYPDRPDDAGDPWLNFPSVTWREAAPSAWFNDTLTLLSLV